MLGIALGGFSMAATFVAIRGLKLGMVAIETMVGPVSAILWGGRMVARAVWSFPGMWPWLIP